MGQSSKSPRYHGVKFKDFEFNQAIGEGSFGKVFKTKHRDTGLIMATKAMKKKFLTQQGQLKYALSESEILQSLDHPFILKLFCTYQTP